MKVNIAICDHASQEVLPAYETDQAAGMDLKAAIDQKIILKPMERKLVPTGIRIALPFGYEAQIRPRSGLALQHGITLLNTPGTIDADYRGEIKVIIINLSEKSFTIDPLMRIAQMVVHSLTKVEWEITKDLTATKREGNGFGHTGLL